MKIITLDKLPIVISGFGAFILMLSITYDYGFFLSFGVGFSEIPTTISDHLRSSLNWIPTAIITFFLFYIFEMFNRRMEQGKTEEELINSSPCPKFTAWFRKLPKYFIIALALFPIVALYYDIKMPIHVWSLTAFIFWFIFHDFIFGHERILKDTSNEVYLMSRWMPFIIMIQIFHGVIMADTIKQGIGNEYILKSKNEQFSGILARAYEKYYLLWDKEKHEIKLISAREIISITSKKKIDK